MAAELQAQMDWDESNLQVQGIFGSQISQTLCPHLSTNATRTWANLQAQFGTPGVSEIVADMYSAYSMKLSTSHNSHPDIKRMNMLFECLNTNGMAFSDMQRGLILFNMILKEWLTVAQIYSQANWTLATTTFIGVHNAIMAEFECTTHPSTIAAHCISAVKCKGQSPTFTKQTQSKSAPSKASGDAPSGAPKKKTRRGGKGKEKVHTIVSSALVPQSVTKHLQETHHTAASPAAPISALIVASMVVGGTSRAPVQVPMTIASFKPSDVTYTKQEVPKNVQAFSGFMGQEGLHTMRPPVAWNGTAPSNPPPSLEARMACATIVENVVASSSHQTLDPPKAPLLECIQTPTPANYAEHAACKKAKRTMTCWGAKKGKKDLVHLSSEDEEKGCSLQLFTPP